MLRRGLQTSGFSNPEKIRKNPEKVKIPDFPETAPEKCYGGVTFVRQIRRCTEGTLLALKSVKNGISFCACDSKIQNDEKYMIRDLGGLGSAPRPVRGWEPSQQISSLKVIPSADTARVAPHGHSSPCGARALE